MDENKEQTEAEEKPVEHKPEEKETKPIKKNIFKKEKIEKKLPEKEQEKTIGTKPLEKKANIFNFFKNNKKIKQKEEISKSQKQDTHSEEPLEKKYNSIRDFFEKEYKKLMIIPIAIFLLALISIGIQIAKTGDFINRDVSLKGGISITVPYDKEINTNLLEKSIADFTGKDTSIRSLKQTGNPIGFVVSIALDDADQNKIDSIIEKIQSELGINIEKGDYSVEFIGSSLGKSFFREIFIAIIVAFLFMSLVVFLFFRNFIPSLAVVICAFCDIIVTVAIVNLLGIRIGAAGIAAYLMLIGYSVDTDMVLTNRVLKRREGTITDRVISAFKTGIMMSITTLAAVIAAIILTTSEVIKEIMIIILIGLIVDLIYTWLQNVGLLRWYLDKKHTK